MDKRKGRTLVRKRTTGEARKPVIGDLDMLFRIFIDYKASQGMRERTLKDHKLLYGYFKKWLDVAYPNISAQDITQQTIQAYVSYMARERVQYNDHPNRASDDAKVGLSPMTINVRLRALKCFIKYLYDSGYIQHNVIAGIKLFKVDEDQIGAFTEGQIKRLFKAVDRKTYAGFRDYTIMLLLLDTGLRISEALSVTYEMFDPNTRLITLSGKYTKNRKLRQVPVSPETAKLLKQLIQENRNLFYPDVPEQLFLTAFGDPLNQEIFARRLKKYAEKAKISGVRVSPHTFRHTFAKFYILNGGDPFTLQSMLGHSTMDMVRKYVQMYSSDVKEQHSRFSPLRRIK